LFTTESQLAIDAWKTVLRQIMDFGDEIEDEDEELTKELLNVIVTVNDPLNSQPPEGYFTIKKLKRCENHFLDPESRLNGTDYGNRIRSHFGFKIGRDVYSIRTDQIESVLVRLKRNNTTRRAIITVFDPSIDHYKDKVPSMVMIDVIIRKNRLYMTAVWRSNDYYGSWIKNFFALKGLSKYLSNNLKIKMGPITVHSVSAHIYKRNYKDVSNMKC
jgi:thymidylate synthase